MTISFKFTPIQRVVAKRAATAETKSPIAKRGLSGVQFVRDAAKLADDAPPPDDVVLIQQAWGVSPERTVWALAEVGYAPKQIAAKLGYKSDDPEFTKLLRDSQDLLKAEICKPIVGQIPAEYNVEVTDTDGVTHNVDIAEKLKKATVKTMFDAKSNTVKFSAMKGAAVSCELGELFGMVIDQVRKQKSFVRSEYARIFRTRDTSGTTSGFRPLAPALAKLGVKATEAPAETK